MGCYFCMPSDKAVEKVLETDTIDPIFTKSIPKYPLRLYTLREEANETSECSEQKLKI
jgi:hypothetical protein